MSLDKHSNHSFGVTSRPSSGSQDQHNIMPLAPNPPRFTLLPLSSHQSSLYGTQTGFTDHDTRKVRCFDDMLSPREWEGGSTRGRTVPAHAPGGSRRLPEHALGVKLLKLRRVYQRFHVQTFSLGAEFSPHNMLNDIKHVEYLGRCAGGKLNRLPRVYYSVN